MEPGMQLGLEQRRLKNRQAQRRYRAKEKKNRADVDEYMSLLESALYDIRAIADTEGFERVASVVNNLLNHTRRIGCPTRPRPWRDSLRTTDLAPAPLQMQSTLDAYPGSLPDSFLLDSSQFPPLTDFRDPMLSCWDPNTYSALLQADRLIASTSDGCQGSSAQDSVVDLGELLE
jgi:hypothetical protein